MSRLIRLDRFAIVLMCIAVSLIVRPLSESAFSLPKLVCLEFAVPALLVLWALRIWQGKVVGLPRPVLLLTISLALWWVVSTLTSIDVSTAWRGSYGRYNGLLTHVNDLMLFWIAATSATPRRGIERLLKALIAILMVVCLYAAAQHFGFAPTGYSGDAQLDGIAPIQNRPASTLGHPVILAATLGLLLPFALAIALASRRRTPALAWSGAFLVMAVTIVWTESRGPWAGALLAIAIVLIAWVRHIRSEPYRSMFLKFNGRILVGVVLVTALGMGLLDRARGAPLMRRAQSLAHLTTDPSLVNRLVFAGAAVKMIRARPIFGSGFETFGLLYPRYRPVEPDTMPADIIPAMVHDGYAQVAVENGVIGLLLYLAFVSTILRMLVRGYFSADTRMDRFFCAAFTASIAGYLIQDLTGWPEIPLSMFFWLICGWAVAISTPRHSRVLVTTPSARRVGSAGAFIVAGGLALTSIAAVRELHADRLVMDAERQSNTDWPAAQRAATTAAQAIPTAHYADAAMRLYLERFDEVGDPEAYKYSAAFADEARMLQPLDPYVLIHRIDLERIALEKATIRIPSPEGEAAASAVTTLDPNNPTAYETVARFQFAAGRPAQALENVRRAIQLRPTRPRARELEGDILRVYANSQPAQRSVR